MPPRPPRIALKWARDFSNACRTEVQARAMRLAWNTNRAPRWRKQGVIEESLLNQQNSFFDFKNWEPHSKCILVDGIYRKELWGRDSATTRGTSQNEYSIKTSKRHIKADPIWKAQVWAKIDTVRRATNKKLLRSREIKKALAGVGSVNAGGRVIADGPLQGRLPGQVFRWCPWSMQKRLRSLSASCFTADQWRRY